MWSEKHKSGKVNFVERYKHPYTGKWCRASVLMEKDTPRIRKEAKKYLDEKISKILTSLTTRCHERMVGTSSEITQINFCPLS